MTLAALFLGAVLGSAVEYWRRSREVLALRRVCGELYGELQRAREDQEWWSAD